MAFWRLQRSTRRISGVDVLVVGAGSAGAVAAVTAARLGARVLLVEREATLGGTSTAVLDTFYGFYTPGPESRRVVDGVGGEVVRRLHERDAAFERPNTYGAGTGITYNPEVLRTVWDDLCWNAGVAVLVHTSVVDVAADDAPRTVGEVLLLSGTELFVVDPQVVIDASGDAVVAHLAGARSEGFGDVDDPQSMTVTFTLGPVDEAAWGSVAREQVLDLLEAASRRGYDLPRRDGSVHRTTVPGVHFVHMTKVADLDPRDPFSLTEAERRGRAQAMEYTRFLRDFVPGFEHAKPAWMSRRIGVRESRRVVGRYWLVRGDVLCGRRFTDAIAQAGAPIEVHARGAGTVWEYLEAGRTYDIPYRCLLPADLDGMLVAGRCLSASHDAHASARNMAQCMAMGQAAGTAAALAADARTDPARLDAQVVRNQLVVDGALLDGATA